MRGISRQNQFCDGRLRGGRIKYNNVPPYMALGRMVFNEGVSFGILILWSNGTLPRYTFEC